MKTGCRNIFSRSLETQLVNIEVTERIARFRLRLIHIVQTLMDAARNIPFENIRHCVGRARTRTWWRLLRRKSLDAKTVVERKKGGVGCRCGSYDRLNKTGFRRPGQKSRHEKTIEQDGAHFNIRLVGIWNPLSEDDDYISLSQQVWTAFFGCLNGVKTGSYYTSAAKKIMEDCLPKEFYPLPYGSLNDATQMAQGLARSSRPKICAHCSVTETRGNWLTAMTEGAGDKYWCANCYEHWKKKGGVMRDLSNTYKMNKTPRPQDGTPCGHCGQPTFAWATNIHDGMWCCTSYPTHRAGQPINTNLRKSDQVGWDTDAEKPGADDDCRFYLRELNSKDKRLWVKEPSIRRWACVPCHDRCRRLLKVDDLQADNQLRDTIGAKWYALRKSSKEVWSPPIDRLGRARNSDFLMRILHKDSPARW